MDFFRHLFAHCSLVLPKMASVLASKANRAKAQKTVVGRMLPGGSRGSDAGVRQLTNQRGVMPVARQRSRLRKMRNSFWSWGMWVAVAAATETTEGASSPGWPVTQTIIDGKPSTRIFRDLELEILARCERRSTSLAFQRSKFKCMHARWYLPENQRDRMHSQCCQLSVISGSIYSIRYCTAKYPGMADCDALPFGTLRRVQWTLHLATWLGIQFFLPVTRRWLPLLQQNST